MEMDGYSRDGRVRILRATIRKAIVIGSLVDRAIFVLGTFSLGFIIPAKDINLTQSLLIGFDNYFHYLRISWASPIIAVA